MTFKEVKQGMMVYLSAQPDQRTTKGKVICPLALGVVEGQFTTAIEIKSPSGLSSICYLHPKHLSPVGAGFTVNPEPSTVPQSEN